MRHLPNASMTIQVPGKLMVAGEFAVLEPYHQLVVMAVDRYVYATLTESSDNYLSLLDFELTRLAWKYENSEIRIATDDGRIRFVKDAMTVAITYLKEHGITPAAFHLSIKSELEDASGVKYGLGSSAAVVTSVVAAILHKYLPAPSAELIFKLAAVAHVKTQGSGSGADVAASSYGGILRYSSFQADWLLENYQKTSSLSELLESDWRYFSVKPIVLPKNVYICIGWTGKPASTSRLIPEIRKLNGAQPRLYKQFLHESEQAVHTFLEGFEKENLDLLFKGVRQNRHALATVGENAGVDVETPLLKTLCDLAEQHGGAGKPSGAGGGDCGIAFMPSKENAQQLLKAWQDAGIKPLTINPNSDGARVVETFHE
ncbi:phosphomevalonate kinase [Lentibacillus populi]|uniref:phosphomevalonate kinase n=1 Tax=Lentibacillus populi TaxID=1827502 RepID=A0A9W5TVK0_9BACI|nr:phosphomevalonate kinase [Lentibacillus populi]GGB35564.1 phosphomevalonate kinase [Lentibacillus populi]